MSIDGQIWGLWPSWEVLRSLVKRPGALNHLEQAMTCAGDEPQGQDRGSGIDGASAQFSITKYTRHVALPSLSIQ